MGHLLGDDGLLGRLNDNSAETETALCVLTIRTLRCAIFAITSIAINLLLLLLLLLRDIIVSFHGQRRLLLLGVN